MFELQTGNGFIKVAREDNGNYGSYDIRLHTGTNGVYKNRVVKSNPATNDWVPSSGDYYDQVLIIKSCFCFTFVFVNTV